VFEKMISSYIISLQVGKNGCQGGVEFADSILVISYSGSSSTAYDSMGEQTLSGGHRITVPPFLVAAVDDFNADFYLHCLSD
jgi:hypothetical protein